MMVPAGVGSLWISNWLPTSANNFWLEFYYSFNLQDIPVRTITNYFRCRPFALSEVLLIIHGKSELFTSSINGCQRCLFNETKRVCWILTEKINPSPFSFYAVWFDKYHVGELVFERAFLEVFLDVISNSELFQALFMIITGVTCTRNQFCRTWWVIVTTGDDLLSDFLGRPPVFLV